MQGLNGKLGFFVVMSSEWDADPWLKETGLQVSEGVVMVTELRDTS